MSRLSDDDFGDKAWAPTARIGGRDDLLSPRTQLVADRDAYLGQSRGELGRRVAADEVELFVEADIAQALQEAFDLQRPQFIALHDIGAAVALRLLASLAGAAGTRVQRLSIRRKGHGVALAVLQFIEVMQADGVPVRMVATSFDGDAATRSRVARVLLAHSRLAVVMVGAVASAALDAHLAPLRVALRQGPWPNRDLLLMPLGIGASLAESAARLVADTPVAVHVTPNAAKPRQAWSYIAGAWNKLHAGRGKHTVPIELVAPPPRPLAPDGTAATEPMPLRALDEPAPAIASAPMPLTPMPLPGGTRWQDYAERCAAIKGCIGACVFDLHTVQPLASSGAGPASERLAQQGATLLKALTEATRALGLGSTPPDTAISTTAHHLLLHPVPGHPGVAAHLVLSADDGNLVLARRQLERIEPPR